MKKICLFFVLTLLLLSLTWVFAAEEISADLNENIVRLHILANSDSAEDQALKRTVRDKLLSAAKDAPQALTDAEIRRICQEAVCAAGYGYPVRIERGRFDFPRKTYENLTLPAGRYNAVRVIIGEGGGENWWCVMYPPLCFSGEIGGLPPDAMAQLKNTLHPETLSAICESECITIKPSFKLLELWQTLKNRR